MKNNSFFLIIFLFVPIRAMVSRRGQLVTRKCGQLPALFKRFSLRTPKSNNLINQKNRDNKGLPTVRIVSKKPVDLGKEYSCGSQCRSDKMPTFKEPMEQLFIGPYAGLFGAAMGGGAMLGLGGVCMIIPPLGLRIMMLGVPVGACTGGVLGAYEAAGPLGVASFIVCAGALKKACEDSSK